MESTCAGVSGDETSVGSTDRGETAVRVAISVVISGRVGGAGGCAGAASALIASPTELIKVRIDKDKRKFLSFSIYYLSKKCFPDVLVFCHNCFRPCLVQLIFRNCVKHQIYFIA